MAFDEYMAERVRSTFQQKNTPFIEKKMMGGLCFMLNDKMCCGIHFDKKRQTNLLMARIGEAVYKEAIQKEGCQPMDFTGRPMKGYVFITPEGFDMDKDLEYWIQLCIDYNPFAKASKKKN